MVIIIGTIISLLASMTLVTLFVNEYVKYLKTDYSYTVGECIETVSYKPNYIVPEITEEDFNFVTVKIAA